MKIFSISLSVTLLFTACAQQEKTAKEIKQEVSVQKDFKLSDYLTENADLDSAVLNLFTHLDDTAIVAQLLMPAVGRYGDEESTIDALVKSRRIGGLLLLNGTKTQCINWVKKYNGITDTLLNLPFLYSADAEPSLFNRKIAETQQVKKAAEMLRIEDVAEGTKIISKELNAIGINYNFSPVVDMSKNGTVGYRGFGQNPANIVPWSNEFIQLTQEANIIATAKHFPGHGLVSGDTHKSLQVIDGELKELGTYPPLIEKGVLSIMIGHLAVMNNEKYATNGAPATTSKTIVTDLLKNELGYKGLIVTDAMNMGGVTQVPQCEVASVKAGVDIVLMPKNTAQAFTDILTLYRTNAEFKARVDESAKKVIRMKVCLGLCKSL